MSTMHRLKAYFGMVPAEDLDEYGPDARGDYRSGYDRYDDDYDDSGYDRGAQRAPERVALRERGDRGQQRVHDRSHDPVDERGPERVGDRYGDRAGDRAGDRGHAPADRALPRQQRRPEPVRHEDYTDRRFRDDDRHEVPPRPRPPARSWPVAPAEPPVRGALAIDPAAAPVREAVRDAVPRTGPFAEEDGHPLARIVTLHPKSYAEARPVGERYREGAPVIMNLTAMDDADAKRLVDFAAGLAFALRGSIDKVTSKVFLLSPADVDVSAEDRRRLAEGGFVQRS